MGLTALSAMFISIGVALDVSSMFSIKQSNQNIADNAVLSAASSGMTTEEKLREYAQSVAEFQGVKPENVNLIKTGDIITVEITDMHKPFFGKIINKEEIALKVVAKSLLPGSGNFNITFALDTTDSMEGAKMTALQNSMTEFLNEIDPFLSANEAQVSIVPFSDYVRIPLSYGSASWIHVQPPQTRNYRVLDAENSENCRQVDTGEGAYTECDTYAYEDRSETTEWKGCMGSRKNEYYKIAAHEGQDLQAFNGATGGAYCYDEYNFMQPLTNDYTTLKTKIDGLNSEGRTYLPAGLIWGWRTLTRDAPFIESRNLASSSPKSILVLMTDGANTISIRGDDDDMLYHWGISINEPDAEARNATIANALTLEICDNIKADNIKIATIAFDIEDTQASQVLRDCASSAADFYTVENSSQLTEAFKDIGQDVSDVRLIE